MFVVEELLWPIDHQMLTSLRWTLRGRLLSAVDVHKKYRNIEKQDVKEDKEWDRQRETEGQREKWWVVVRNNWKEQTNFCSSKKLKTKQNKYGCEGEKIQEMKSVGAQWLRFRPDERAVSEETDDRLETQWICSGSWTGCWENTNCLCTYHRSDTLVSCPVSS